MVVFGTMAWILSSWPGINAIIPELSSTLNPVQQLGVALVSPEAYVIPFELASVLLLAALIGASIVAWERE